MLEVKEVKSTGGFTPARLISSRNSRPLFPGITTSEKIRSNCSVRNNSTARPALSQTVASCPARRNARESEARVLASSSTSSKCAFRVTIFSRRARSIARRGGLPRRGHCGIASGICGTFLCGHARLAARQLDPESCAVAFFATHRNCSAVIADHRLHNRQPQPRSLLLCGVVRREQPRAFFRRQTLTSVRNFDAHSAL